MNSPISKKLIYTSVHRDPDQDHYNRHEVNRIRQLHLMRFYYDDHVPVARLGDFENHWQIQIQAVDRCPDLSDPEKISFSEATDRRSQELLNILQTQDQPCLIFWSGGIDSTLILSSIIRNWPSWAKERLIVVMNNSSYFENPIFFQEVIKKNNLRYQLQSNGLDWTNSFVISALAADPLWIHSNVIDIEIWRPGAMNINPITHPDLLLQWLEFKTDTAHAYWFYELIIKNSVSAGIDLRTYEDFFWWINFNFLFVGHSYKLYSFLDESNFSSANLDLYKKNLISWYRSDDYQRWSYQNSSTGIKYDGSIRSYKMPAKKYIYDLDHNSWYRDYKTKTGSSYAPYKKRLIYLYDDGDFGTSYYLSGH